MRTADPWLRRHGRLWRVKRWFRVGWRWQVAEFLNRSPWTCWSDLVEWALPDPDAPSWRSWLGRFPRLYDGMDGERRRLRDITGRTDSCRAQRDDPALGCCYCGKFRRSADGTVHP